VQRARGEHLQRYSSAESKGFAVSPLSSEYGTCNYFTEMCSGSEAGSYLRLVDFLCHSTLGLRVLKKKEKIQNSQGLILALALR